MTCSICLKERETAIDPVFGSICKDCSLIDEYTFRVALQAVCKIADMLERMLHQVHMK